MISLNKEIIYNSGIDHIEHLTGKKVLSWEENNYKDSISIYFTDGTQLELRQGYEFPKNPEYKKITEGICISCGEHSHCGYIDGLGRCSITVKNFWNKVRKIFWHRYLNNK